jgi:hypothetical protein
VAAITVPIAVSIIGFFFLLLLRPGPLRRLFTALSSARGGRLASTLQRLSEAAWAYRGQGPLLLAAAALSFLVHFCTAAMYYFTALAIGSQAAHFWEICFASTIQIFATVMSPFTIAGEGVREIVQAILLAHRIGVSQSILSAALGFWAAEALTLFGGVFYLLRRPDYRPHVDIGLPAGGSTGGTSPAASPPPPMREVPER